MQVNKKFISIDNNEDRIKSFLLDAMFKPRLSLIEWSKITKQTPSFKIGYPVQHLASLITGVEGGRSGARGDDLVDRSEVKGCNRVDQVDNCKECKSKVMRLETACPKCGSKNIKRMDDSKWLISIKSEDELNLSLNLIPRFVFIIMYYPFLKESNFDSVKIEAFEIWPQYNQKFRQLMENYYYNIYLEHIKKNPNKTPAPQNFWPFSFQFYLSLPVKVFECDVLNINSMPKININSYLKPFEVRSLDNCELMPVNILKKEEIKYYGFEEKDFLNKNDIEKIDLRNTQRAVPHKEKYRRIKAKN